MGVPSKEFLQALPPKDRTRGGARLHLRIIWSSTVMLSTPTFIFIHASCKSDQSTSKTSADPHFALLAPFPPFSPRVPLPRELLAPSAAANALSEGFLIRLFFLHGHRMCQTGKFWKFSASIHFKYMSQRCKEPQHAVPGEICASPLHPYLCFQMLGWTARLAQAPTLSTKTPTISVGECKP